MRTPDEVEIRLNGTWNYAPVQGEGAAHDRYGLTVKYAVVTTSYVLLRSMRTNS